MSTGDIALINGALRLLGEISITSLDEGTDLSATCNELYPDFARGLLAAHPWRFTMAKAQLSRSAAAPTNEWRYRFAAPPDQLVLRHLFPNAALNQQPLRDYELFGAEIFANEPALWADYQREIAPAIWPPYFVMLARTALASELAVAVTGSTTQAEFWRARAYGTPQEGGNGGLMRTARTVDSQQQPPQPITDFPLLAARLGGR